MGPFLVCGWKSALRLVESAKVHRLQQAAFSGNEDYLGMKPKMKLEKPHWLRGAVARGEDRNQLPQCAVGMGPAVVTQRGHAAQVDRYVGMELVAPAIDFVALARALGVAAERARTVHEATDLISQGLSGDTAMLIDVALDRGFKPM